FTSISMQAMSVTTARLSTFHSAAAHHEPDTDVARRQHLAGGAGSTQPARQGFRDKQQKAPKWLINS
ncbi:hypothetical protein, partial [Burkholderia singularis]|uniref:hypothetical protein n=1 Tax=Burkholderia singularis TaxID=1503053 RepID=UPI001C487FC0